MYVMSIHEVSDPEAFWGGQLDLPAGTELPILLPSSDGAHGVCIFRTDSVDTVRSVVDGATAQVAKTAYYAINEGGAQGLPA